MFFCVIANSEEGLQWELEKEKNGISVYSSEDKKSKIKIFRVEMLVKSSLSAFIALLNDTDAHAKWVYNGGVAEVLKQINVYENYVYTTSKVPWPAKDRDGVTYSKIEQDPLSKKVKITFLGKPDYIPEEPNYIRVLSFNGFWLLIPQENKTVKFINQWHLEPGGNIPAWLTNQVIRNTLFKTMQNIVTIIQEDKYQLANIPYIEES